MDQLFQESTYVVGICASDEELPALPDTIHHPTSFSSMAEQNQPAHTAQKGWRFWLVFCALCLCIMVAALDMGSMATALPVIVHDLGGNQSFVWVSASYSLATTAIIPLSGRLAEIFGRRHILLFSLVVFGAGSLMCSLAHNMIVLIIGRAIQGVGTGIIQTLTTIIVADIVTLKERGLYSSLIGLAFTVVTGIGPFIGGAIVQQTTWRWLFYITLPMSGLAFVVVFFFLHLKRPARPPLKESIKAMDPIGNLLIMLSTASCIIALTWGGIQAPWISTKVLVPIILGIIGLLVSILYEIKIASHPSIPLNILSNRTSMSGYCGSFLHGIVITCVTFYLPIYFQAGKAHSPLLSGLLLFPTVIVISPSAIVQGLIVSKFGHYKKVNIIGWALMLIGLGLLTIIDRSTSTGATVPIQIICSVGFGFLYSTTFAVLAPLDATLNAPALSFLTFVRTFPQPWGYSIGATVIQNELKKRLPQEFIAQIGASSGDLTYVAIPAIKNLGEPLRGKVEDAYNHALHVLWMIMLGVCCIGFLTPFLQKEIPLHQKNDNQWGMKEEPNNSTKVSNTAEKSNEELAL